MQHKKNKNKNTFSKLRGQFKNALNRLDTEQRANNILNQEVARLKGILDIQQKQVAALNDQLKTEANRTSDLTNNLKVAKKNREFFYKQWIKDHGKIKIWKQIATYSMIVNIIGLAIIIFRSL